MSSKIYISRSVNDTMRIAQELAEDFGKSTVLALHGDLGSGKTCFIHGIARALEITQPTTSPTFTIINEYFGTKPLYHIDLYRLSGPDEALFMGLEEYMTAEGVTAVEWAERAYELFPSSTINISFSVMDDENSRLIEVTLPE